MITVMFPSRGRPKSLFWSLAGLAAHARMSIGVQYLVACDPDDQSVMNIASWLTGVEVWQAPQRFGYRRQQHYYNGMLPLVKGDWIVLWGDDAEMTTPSWDAVISQHQPAVLWPESNGYPHCFPVVPAAWARALGRFSPSAHPDSYWLSVGKGLDRHTEIPVKVRHRRFDLTGDHDDATYREGRGSLGQTGMADDGGGELVARDIEAIRRLL